MLAHAYNIIIDHGVGSPVYVREVVGGFNATDKRFLSMLMKTVQLPDASEYNIQMIAHTSTVNK